VWPPQQNLPPLAIPLQQVPPATAVAAVEEKVGSLRLTLSEEIDQFHFEKERALEGFMELSDSETESDRFSSAHLPKLIVTQVDTSSKEEEEQMDLRKRQNLRGLMANRKKGTTSKEALKTQVPANLPSPPPTEPLVDLGLRANHDLMKKRPMQKLEKGKLRPQKGTK